MSSRRNHDDPHDSPRRTPLLDRALIVACGGRQPLGYGGPPIANAVRAVVRPAHSSPLLYAGDGSNRPFVYTHVLVKNISPYPVRIHACIATALDGDARELFRSSVVALDALLRPGHRMGGLKRGDYGGEVAP